MAKRRLADEYDAAHEWGEVRTQGNIPHKNVSTLAEIGLTHKDIQASPGVVRRLNVPTASARPF